MTLGASYTRLSPVSSNLGGGAIVGAATPGPLTVGPCPTGGAQCVLDSGGQPVGAAGFDIETPRNNYALTASLSVPVSDYVLSLASGLEAAKASERAARLLTRAQRRKAAADGQLAFYDWARSLAQAAVADHAVARNEDLLRDAKARFEQGTATKADVLRVQSLLATSRVAAAQGAALERLAAERLAITLGDGTAIYTIGEDVLAPTRALARSASLAALLRESRASRLETRAIRQSTTATRSAARSLRARKFPRLDGFFDYTYANPARGSIAPSGGWGGSWQAGATLTWTVNDFLSGRSEINEAEANARRLDAEKRMIENAVRTEVTAGYYDQKRALDAQRAAASAERAAVEAVRIQRELYTAGRATTAEVLDAEQELIGALLQRANAILDSKVAKTRLAFAVGRPI